MALKDWSLGAFNNGAVRAWFTWDDVTNRIQSVTIVNNDAQGTATLTLRDRQTNAVLYGPISRTFGTGTVTQDVSGFNLQMVPISTRGGIGMVPPFNPQFQWS